MKKKTTMTIIVDESDKVLLKKIAEKEDKSVSAVVRTAVKKTYAE